MTPDTRTALNEITALVDTYNAERSQMPLHALVELRSSLAVWLFRLSAEVKAKYGARSLAYAMRKHAIAKAMFDAAKHDIATIGKSRAVNLLEAEAEATDRALFLRQEEARTESEHEEVRAIISATQHVLAAMQQEIAILAHEYKNQHHANQH